MVITAPFKKTGQTPRLLGAFATRGAVPCLSTDLTTHAVSQFIQALQMGRRDAVRGSDNGRGREAQMGRRDAVCGSDNGRGREARQGTRGAVPCLSTDLTTHAVPHFIQAFQMGRRGARRRARARRREARQGLRPGDVRSSLWRAAAGEGTKRDEVCSHVRSSLRRGAPGEGAEAMCSSARVGVGVGAEACSSINFGRPGALLGSSVAFGSGCG